MAGGPAGVARTLLERDVELAAVDDALTAVTGVAPGAVPEPADGQVRRRGGLLAFAGPAGLGKTTLLAEVRARAADRGCTVLSARGGDQEQQVAFHVARQLLQPLLAGSTEADLRAALGSWYGIVGPALGLCTAQGAAPDPQGLRDGLDWVLTHVVVRHAPVVLVLDDAHWADPQSLNWLAAFAPRTDDLALLVVVAYRPDELPPSAEAFRGLPGRAGHRPLGLEPLTSDAIGLLVRDRVGAHADEEFCRECWAVTAGNPFEAVELAAKVRDRGLQPDGGSVHLLRDLVAAVKGSGLVARLERLGPSTVRLAWAAAVLGTEIRPALAAAVAGLGTQEAADCADRLRAARVLTGSRTLEFVHPLIATAVYRAIPDAVRVALHGKAAWAVVDAGLGPTAAARHLLETHPEEDPWVVHQLRAAAREILRAGAPEAARSCLARALREPPPPGERAGVLYELGCATGSWSPRPPSTTCGPPSKSRSTTPNCATASSSCSPSPSRTATGSARQPTSSAGPPAPPPGHAPDCACRPSSSCGTPSAPTNPTRPAGPAGWPGSPTASPAATSPSGTSSACAPGTPPCAANPPAPSCATPPAPCAAACPGWTRAAASRCRRWSR